MKLFNSFPYKAILLDLGGVFFYFDWDSFCEKLAATSPSHTGPAIKAILTAGLQHEYETGRINTEGFYSALRTKAGFTDSLHNFTTKLSDCVPYNAAIALLPELAQCAPLILTSNTNEAHAHYVEQYPNFANHFTNMQYSFNIGLSKPTPAFFNTVLNTLNLKAEEALFVDDLLINLQSARDVGLHILQYRQPEDLANLLPQDIASDSSFSYN